METQFYINVREASSKTMLPLLDICRLVMV